MLTCGRGVCLLTQASLGPDRGKGPDWGTAGDGTTVLCGKPRPHEMNRRRACKQTAAAARSNLSRAQSGSVGSVNALLMNR